MDNEIKIIQTLSPFPLFLSSIFSSQKPSFLSPTSFLTMQENPTPFPWTYSSTPIFSSFAMMRPFHPPQIQIDVLRSSPTSWTPIILRLFCFKLFFGIISFCWKASSWFVSLQGGQNHRQNLCWPWDNFLLPFFGEI